MGKDAARMTKRAYGLAGFLLALVLVLIGQLAGVL
jgi:hypothetical protein